MNWFEEKKQVIHCFFDYLMMTASRQLRTIAGFQRKVLMHTSKSEWNALEQTLKTLDPAAAGKTPAEWAPLAGSQDEVGRQILR